MAKDITVALTLDNKQFNNALAQSEKKTTQFASKSSSAVTGLRNAFAGLAAALSIREIVNISTEFTTLNNRLRAVTSSEREAASALQLVKEVASATRSDLSAVASLFSDITLATEDMGLTQQQVAGIATTFSQALKISGADAGTAAGAIRQFGQALASGVLRGDEFNSINEANSKFMGEFADALGVTRGELRNLASQGLITADVMVQATQKMAGQVEADFKTTVGTVDDAFTRLRNSIVGAFGEIDKQTGASSALAEAITKLADKIDDLGKNSEDFVDTLKTLGRVLLATVGIFALFRAGTIDAAAKFVLLDNKVLNFAATGGIVGQAIRGLITNFGTFGLAIKAVVLSLVELVVAFGKFKWGAIASGILTVARAFGALLIASGPVALAIGGIALAIEGVGRVVTGGESPFGMLYDQIMELVGGTEESVDSLSEMETEADAAADACANLEEQLKKTTDATDDNINVTETYADWLKKLTDQINENVQETAWQSQALKEIKDQFIAGTISLEYYTEALKLLGDSTIDVSERLETATNAVNDFNDAVAEGTADLQKELDQMNMSELERSLDDIRTDLELLRDETLSDLQDQLKNLHPVIDATAIATIKAQMQDVTAATEEAIKAQQALAEEAYNSSRTFETGWAQAWQDYLDNLNDKAAVAKNVFDTFTKGIEDAFVNFAKTGKLSFKDLIDSMIEIIVRSQVQKMIASIFGAFGGGGTSGGIGGFFKSIFGFADGGRPPIGRPSIVGEKGPELFVPNTAGTIVPNDQLGGGVVNNTYITNQISALDAKSVAQLFAENRKTLLGTVQMAQKEMPYSI